VAQRRQPTVEVDLPVAVVVVTVLAGAVFGISSRVVAAGIVEVVDKCITVVVEAIVANIPPRFVFLRDIARIRTAGVV